MADPDEVAKKDGAHRTNKVTIEPGAVLDPDYTCTVLENEIGATGRLKVLRLAPSSREGAAPCFLGRWDEKDKALDFDFVDTKDNVQPVEFPGHHSTDLGDRRFGVEIRDPNAVTKLVFKGVVVVRLGFKMHAETGHYRLL
jgi:hypothetical protein